MRAAAPQAHEQPDSEQDQGCETGISVLKSQCHMEPQHMWCMKQTGASHSQGTLKNRRVCVLPEELHPSARQMQAACASATQRRRGHTHITTSLGRTENPWLSWGLNSFCLLSQCTVNLSIHPSHLELGLSSLICYPRKCPSCLRCARKRDFPLLPVNGCSGPKRASSKEHRRIQVSLRPERFLLPSPSCQHGQLLSPTCCYRTISE